MSERDGVDELVRLEHDDDGGGGGGERKRPRASKSKPKRKKPTKTMDKQRATSARRDLRSKFKPTKTQHEQVIKLQTQIGTVIEDARYANRMDESDMWFYGHNECDLTVARFLEQLRADWTKADEEACRDFEPPQQYINHLGCVLTTVQCKAGADLY